MGFTTFLAVPSALAVAVSRNFAGFKIAIFIVSFALLVSLEISVPGSCFGVVLATSGSISTSGNDDCRRLSASILNAVFRVALAR